MNPIKVYMASRFKTHREVNKIADRLEAQGFSVISTWHRVEAVPEYNSILPPPAKGPDRDARSMFVAQRDMDEIREADILFLYTHDCDLTPGGMWVEMGYAMALNKRVYVHGPRTNVFCHCATLVEFDDKGDIVIVEDSAKYFQVLSERNKLMQEHLQAKSGLTPATAV
jgi:nucleoside 2-deoxyribosyltransferase